MTAPVLVMVAHGGEEQEPRVARVVHALREDVAAMRPEVHPHVAFLDEGSPSVAATVDRLVSAGVGEIAIVPLELANAVDVDPRFGPAVAAARATHAGVRIGVARPIGPESVLLSVLDARLRSALAAARVLELDGLVLSSDHAGDVRGAALLARRARQWSTHHRLPCLTAVADGSGPSVGQAIQGLRSQGRRHIAVGAFFLAPTMHYTSQADQARRYGAVAVSEPLGSAPELTHLVLARYAFAAMDLLELEQGDDGRKGSFLVSA